MHLKFKTRKMNWLSRIPVELIIWVLVLTLLGLAKPVSPDSGQHFTFCPLANLGLTWCPGCGLGRSVTQFLHGHIRESLHYHWLGIPAVFIIMYRIMTLGRYEFRKIKNKKNKETDYV